ncbi:phage terminase small subunit P27 family [Corticicoccus populi]|uniref:Phage terminase small subunit P27 family n=1 Tax=Corticicoccus populi TaxID=1812821 RepID=A0ABW5WTA4_9STAP
MGRKRKFYTTRNETKEEQAQRNAINNKLEDFSSIQSTPPAYLSKLGKAEFRRLKPLLDELPISSLDLNLIVVYCELYATYRQLQDEMNKEGLIIESYFATGELKERKINVAQNEIIKVSKELRAIGSELGLSVSSRMKLVEPSIQEDDPFKDMFDGD